MRTITAEATYSIPRDSMEFVANIIRLLGEVGLPLAALDPQPIPVASTAAEGVETLLRSGPPGASWLDIAASGITAVWGSPPDGLYVAVWLHTGEVRPDPSLPLLRIAEPRLLVRCSLGMVNAALVAALDACWSGRRWDAVATGDHDWVRCGAVDLSRWRFEPLNLGPTAKPARSSTPADAYTSAEELSSCLGGEIAASTLVQLAADHGMPHIRGGAGRTAQYLFRRDEVEKWLLGRAADHEQSPKTGGGKRRKAGGITFRGRTLPL